MKYLSRESDEITVSMSIESLELIHKALLFASVKDLTKWDGTEAGKSRILRDAFILDQVQEVLDKVRKRP